MLLSAKKEIYLEMSKQSSFSSLKNNLLGIFSPKYYIVYKNQAGQIKTYEIGRINLHNSFGNRSDHRSNIGFKAYCFGRKQVRSFRHDRILSITKK